MEMGSAQQFLNGRTILVTGATGFLAKVFVEKLLRIQSDVKKLYLLLRASDTDAATKRLDDEIISQDLFKVLRDMWGTNFRSFISEKVVAVAGDVSLPNLGINDENVENEISKEIDIIVNVAATTNFDERFDIALGTNTMGALHVLNFAKTCPKIKALLHVSTAYVCGEAKVDREVIKEEPFQMGQTLNNGVTKLDIEEEKILMEKRLEELRAKNVDENALKSAMKDYGFERANLHGWPNTYAFTKAMGEMFLSHLKDNIPLIIVRPTIVSSTFKEPFPGWIEGFRTIDSVIGGYGKGMFTHFLGRPKTIVDLIPVDMVINSMMAALKLIIHSKHRAQQENYIYHVCSSFRNHLTMSRISDLSYLYFSKNPLTKKNGKPIILSKAKFLPSLPSFQRHLMLRYLLPLKGLNLVNKVFCLNIFQDVYRSRIRKVQRVIRMAKIYEPYLVFKAIFNDANTESLRMKTKMEKAGDGEFDFEFDPLSIDWTDYITNVHIPGFIKFAMK